MKKPNHFMSSLGIAFALLGFLTLLLAAASLLAPADAQTRTSRQWDQLSAQRYAACLQRVKTDPAIAYEEGLAWRFEGGGAPARHCVAASLVALGQFAEGAARLQETATAPDAGDDVLRADILSQSGSAWLQADRPAEAEQVLTQALTLRPNDPDVLIDRAIARALQEQFRSASEDLSVALSARPDDLDALRLRANAWVEMGRYEDAARDVIRGLTLAPNDVEMLLVRGRVVQALGPRTPPVLR